MSNQRMSTDISITINGEERQVPSGLNVRNLLGRLGLDQGQVAVELNRRLVRKAEWDQTAIEAGASVEIVTFVGGGAQ